MFEIFESLKCLKVQQVSRFQGPVVLTSSPGLAGPAGQGGAGWAGWVAGLGRGMFQTFKLSNIPYRCLAPSQASQSWLSWLAWAGWPPPCLLQAQREVTTCVFVYMYVYICACLHFYM